MPTNPPLTGLFLGAGASYETGMPLVWELTDEIKRWLTPEKLRHLNQQWRTQGGGYSDIVIEDLASILAIKTLHYESILGWLECQFLRKRSLIQEYHGLYSWLVELVYLLLYQRHIKNTDYIQRHLAYYEGIRTLSTKNSPLWIFSLNHDLIIEAIAAHFSIPICCGFSKNIVTLPSRDPIGNLKGKLHAEVLTKNDLENGAMYFPNPGQPGIHLLKIHGALDIFTFNDGEDLLKLLPNEQSLAGVIDMLRIANEELFYPAPDMPLGKVKTTNEISYADEKGEMQFLRRSLLAGAFKFDARHTQVLPASLLKHFRANINFVSNLICVGYSFGDIHINNVLKEWLEFHHDRHLEIVSPTAEFIPSFLLHLAPQISIVKSTATDHLDTLAGITRPHQETVKKSVFSYFRSRGKEQTKDELTEFMRQDIESKRNAFFEKLKSLPLKDGVPDFSALGPPDEVAKKWATEIYGDEETQLEKLINYFNRSKCL